MTKQEYKALVKRAKADKEVRDWRAYIKGWICADKKLKGK